MQEFTVLQRALTLAGLAPALLIGAGTHRDDLPADLTPPTYRVAVPPAPAPLPVFPAPAALTTSIDALARDFGGVVGIAVRSLEWGWQVDANADRRMPQQSVSKLWVAMTVLNARDEGRLTLDDPVTLTRDNLTVFHQPLATLIVKNGMYQTTVRELLLRAMQQSDNTANDTLLRLAGGPQAVRAFIAEKGLGDIRFGPGEKLLQAKTAGLTWKPEYSMGRSFQQARAALPPAVRRAAFDAYVADPPDGAAPSAIALALARLKAGEVLKPDSARWLMNVMEGSHTGRMRLRGAVPPGWTFGHKTGTGQDLGGRTAGYNDVGILTAPDGKAYTIAVMIGDTPRPIPQRQELMQAVVASIVANHR
ncbi:serine hydrolase [Sphingomonas sp.]|uniref:serine hydrolase n=1 Tax=Sphingomonas sp. TaxID=28214 RepID=UPI001ED02331|nr:serine hydrolase [Sphingomonas sp.]MBX3593584.1 serine hydrolase [Sphingomonas sp.]